MSAGQAAGDAGAVRVVSIDDCGPAVAAWTLRLAVAAVTAAVIAAMTVNHPPVALVFAGVLLGAGVLLSPGSAAAAALSALAALVSVVYGSGAPLQFSVLALVLLVHLLHVTCGLAAVVPRGARVHLSALRRPARRFALVQLAVFALALLSAALPAGRNPWHLEVVAIVAIAGLAAAVLVVFRRR